MDGLARSTIKYRLDPDSEVVFTFEDECCGDDDFIVSDSGDESDSSDKSFIRESIPIYDFEEDVAIVPEKTNPKLFITKVVKCETTREGKQKKSTRVYNSYQFCLSCSKKVSNFSQHIFRAHKSENEIKEISQMNSTRDRKRAISLLRQRYNHENNINSIRKGFGEIILQRRPTSGLFDLSEYGPCPDCLLWVQQRLLKNHEKKCLKKNKPGSCPSLGCMKIKSDALAGRINTDASEKLVKEVFSIMRSDDVGKVAPEDPLIVALGNQWIEKNVGNELKRGKYTSQIMRLCAKLLMELRTITKLDLNSFADYLVPENFNHIVQAVLKVSALNDQNIMNAPSNAIKIGHDLKRLIDLKIVFCGIIRKDEKARKEAEDLLKMIKVLWGPKVTKAARVLLDSRKFQKNSPLPAAEDIQKLTDHLKQELQKLDLGLRTYDNFVKVAELAISRIVSYNRRRTGEVEAVRVEDYCRRTKGVVNDISELTSFERRLLETQDVMEVRGKTGRGVPILIPNDVQKSMDYLASSDVRQTCGVRSPYLFARKGDGIVRAYDALQKTSSAAGVEEPSRVTSTQLRKYMATITQVLDLKENEMTWVLNHLGHTLDVHNIFYRATSNVIERTQVAKILLMQDHSKIKEFAKRKLEEIQMNELIFDDPSNQNQEEDLSQVLAQSETFDDDENQDEDVEMAKARAHLTRKPWTQEEEDEIRSELKDCFDRCRRPSVKEVEKCRRKSKARGTDLHLRTKSTLKKKIFRMIDKIRKRE